MADVAMDLDDLAKLKVADLRRELKSRGLSTVGNKTELLERLQISLQSDGGLVSESDSGAVDAEEIDEDDVLGDEPLEDDNDLDINKTDESMTESPKITIKRRLENEDKAKRNQRGKKIVLDRSVLLSSEKENVVNEVVKTDEEEQLVTEPEETDKKVVKLSTVSMTERLQLRAQKFGVPLPGSVEAKKEARAARFGIRSTSVAFSKAAAADPEVLRKRAERFGLPISSQTNKAEVEEKLKKRMERFGGVQSASNATVEEKKQQRAERFKITI